MASEYSPRDRTHREELDALVRRYVADTTARELAKSAVKQAERLAATAEKVALTAEKVSQASGSAKAQRLAANARRFGSAARRAEQVEALAQRLDTSATDALEVWLRRRPEGRRPRLSHDDLAAAAMHLADTEGLDALSMRRLAAELEVGTMTLYHYVRTKDEVLALLVDEVMGEVVLPDDEALPDGWKPAITAIARRSLASLRRHPWVLDIASDLPFGPNGARHFDQTLAAVSTYPGTLADRLDLITAVDEFVFGYATFDRVHFTDLGHQAPVMEGYVADLLATGDYPQMAALAAEHGIGGALAVMSLHARDAQRFERNLARLLAGFERS